VNNVNVSLSADRKHFYNEAGGRVISRKSLDAYSAGIGGDRSDSLGEGGIFLWNVAVSGGYVDLSDNADNEAADRRGPNSWGTFHKLGVNVSRLQRLGERDTLWFSLTSQRALKNLDSSEKFSLGGSQALRAYPSAEASGDTGSLATIEHRHSFSSNFQLASFYDHGWIRINDDPAYPGAPNLNSYWLRGWGLSFSYTEPGDYALRLTAARRVGTNPAAKSDTGTDSDGTLRKVRVWMSAVVYF
jgi:hemolysin activation/secretion protein